MKSNGRSWLRILAAVTLLSVSGCQTTRDAKPPETFRVMTYNIHHGEGLDGKVDLQRIAEAIQREGADIVALQEVDKGVLRTERRDLPAELAALTGMTCVFSNNFHYQGGEYGNAVLTRFPVLNATNSHYQMLRTNEQRGILQLTLEVRGRMLVVMNTHVDPRRDDAERMLNAREIRALVAQQGGKPVVLCGDFNDTPSSRVYRQLETMFDDSWEAVGQGQGWTYSAGQPRKRIDYVWLSKNGDLRPIKAYIPTSNASDHLPLVVLLQFR